MLSAFSASRNQQSERHVASDVELGGVFERQMSQPTTQPTSGPTQERLADTRLSRSQTMQARSAPTTDAEPKADKSEKCNFAFVCVQRFEQTFVTTADFCWPFRQGLVWQESPSVVHEGGNSHTTGSEPHGTTVRHRTTGLSRKARGVPLEIQQGSQVEVMQAIHDAAYAQGGSWKRFVPFLELQAQEVLFHFDGALRNGRAKAVVELLDPKAISADIGEEISQLRAIQAEDDDHCFGSWHSEKCIIAKNNHTGYECPADRLCGLLQRQEGVRRRHELGECIATPAKVEHRDWLSTGLMQEGFVQTIFVDMPLDEPSVNRKEQHRAVFVTFRWNIKRFIYDGTLLFTLGTFTWIVALVWAGITLDFNTAAAIGSFLMSTVLLIIQSA